MAPTLTLASGSCSHAVSSNRKGPESIREERIAVRTADFVAAFIGSSMKPVTALSTAGSVGAICTAVANAGMRSAAGRARWLTEDTIRDIDSEPRGVLAFRLTMPATVAARGAVRRRCARRAGAGGRSQRAAAARAQAPDRTVPAEWLGVPSAFLSAMTRVRRSRPVTMAI